ncbi:MAG: CaiB/BaiF CoA-transferase family protein [Actinomycetota bacterium]
MGPLSSMTVIELAGIGPGPMCGMMLADLGARVIRVDRPSAVGGSEPIVDVSARNKESIAVDLKTDAGKELVLDLCRNADALIEGFRPGVTERLGLGPDECLAANPKLVYGRMTGWGQEGPLAGAAGHDINYIALTGALHAIGEPGRKPVPPINLVGDFGGGGMLLAYGVLAGIIEARISGAGQVVDAAMVDGTAALMAMASTHLGRGVWNGAPGEGSLAGGSHYYNTYETSDGRWICIGSIEPQFYALLLDTLDLLPDEGFAEQRNPERWPELKNRLAEIFATKTRDEWVEIMEGTDICFAPVLDLHEAADHPHAVARNTYVEHDGFLQPAPAPRFSGTPGTLRSGAPRPGEQTSDVLASVGYASDRIQALIDEGAVSQA